MLDHEGDTFTGANVENAGYGSAICAEAVSISGAVVRGVRSIVAVAVACIDAEEVDGAYPCSNCRQIMNEFGVQRVIVTSGEDTEVREHTLQELLPHGFDL